MTATKDVRLRDLVPADSDNLFAWRNLPDIRRWMYTDHEISPEEHARWFEAASRDASRKYWIIELDGRPVGLANLADIAPAHRKATWAYYLADAAVRGRGVGAYVEYLVIEHVFSELKLGKLWCEVLIDNKGVIKLHETFGFQREALFREHVVKGGAPQDVVGLGLLAADWVEVREATRERLQRHGFTV
jgi:UDP-4-amino-4,6-dideoxy-N-acetyl-beta-L-altrosamine N-acetyltransferase